jgi:2-methylcitrate dehydratase PrpD
MYNTKNGKGVTQALADFAASVTFNDLPKEVIHQTKRVILDSIACTLGGYSSEKGYISRKMMKALGGNQEATILGSGEKNSVVNTAFVNANMGNAIDMDDTVLMTHPAVPTVMGALPLAEREKVRSCSKINLT